MSHVLLRTKDSVRDPDRRPSPSHHRWKRWHGHRHCRALPLSNRSHEDVVELIPDSD